MTTSPSSLRRRLVIRSLVILGLFGWAASAVAGPQTMTEHRVPTGPSALAPQPQGASFYGWLRYPAETAQWTSMTGVRPTAYFRDVLVGGNTLLSSPRDQDTWRATAWLPDGTVAEWTPIQFLSSYADGSGTTRTNCFVSSQWTEPVCNTTALQVIWYTRSQCLATGEWTMTFFQNDTPLLSGQFTVLPEIPPDALPHPVNQLSYKNQDPSLRPQLDSACSWQYSPFNSLPYAVNGSCAHPPYGVCVYCQFDCPDLRSGCTKCPSTDPLPHCIYPANVGPVLVSGQGCNLISNAALLQYHLHAAVDPLVLNSWLTAHDGFFEDSANLNFLRIADYGNSFLGTSSQAQFGYVGHIAEDETPESKKSKLTNALCTYGPQVIGVYRHGTKGPVNHFVLVTGLTSDKRTFNVLDTWNDLDDDGIADGPVALSTTLDNASNPCFSSTDSTKSDGSCYSNTFYDAHILQGPGGTFSYDKVVIDFHSPGELLLTDPLGRRTGLDPSTGLSYREIPSSSYSLTRESDIERDVASETKVLAVGSASPGTYTLRITGTGEGPYTIGVHSYDASQTPATSYVLGVPISTGEVHTLQFDKSSVPGSGLELHGQFDGKGQRPVDVNKLLTYLAPSQVSTTLPAGTLTTGVVIFYDAAIVPGTFTAQLNGQDVSALFSPVPGSRQVVRLDLQRGRNVLKLSVDGNLSRRVTDTDRLVFIVP